MDLSQFEGRKREHLRHALDPSHQASGLGGLDRVRLVHEALPELDLEEVKLAAPCLGRPMPTPFFVAGMTAGHADAFGINRTLALACCERGWAMGVGSQRRQLLGDSSEIDRWKQLRDEVPELALFANIGVSQLISEVSGSAGLSRVASLVESIRAQALVVHANALQESIQPEGTPRFKGSLDAITRACAGLGVPVVLKETGCGFSGATLARLARSGLAAVDVSGLGGTHWGRIEGARAPEDSLFAEAAETFAEWGEPTVDSVLAMRVGLPGTELWASGGVRTGLDAAKLIALGAHRVGFAQPALEAALAGPRKLRSWMETREYELKVALFCTGCPTPEALRQKEGTWRRTDA